MCVQRKNTIHLDLSLLIWVFTPASLSNCLPFCLGLVTSLGNKNRIHII